MTFVCDGGSFRRCVAFCFGQLAPLTPQQPNDPVWWVDLLSPEQFEEVHRAVPHRLLYARTHVLEGLWVAHTHDHGPDERDSVLPDV